MEPGVGIALGLGPLQHGLQRDRFPAGGKQPVVQALPALIQQGKIRLLHGPQPGKNGPLAILPQHRSPAGRLLFPVHAGHRLRQQRQRLLPRSRSQQIPHQCSGRKPLLQRTAVVGRPLSGHCKRLDRALLPQQRLTVLNAQNVVGLSQQIRPLRPQQTPNHRLAASRVRLPLSQKAAQPRCKSGGKQTFRHIQQGAAVAALAAEHLLCHHAGGLQHLHTAVRKPLRRGHGPGQRQLQHQIHAAFHRGPGPGVLAQQGKIPPLDKVPAHDAHKGRLRSKPGADLLHQV